MSQNFNPVWGFPKNRGTPSHHPFRTMGFSRSQKNIQLLGTTICGNPPFFHHGRPIGRSDEHRTCAPAAWSPAFSSSKLKPQSDFMRWKLVVLWDCHIFREKHQVESYGLMGSKCFFLTSLMVVAADFIWRFPKKYGGYLQVIQVRGIFHCTTIQLLGVPPI